MAPVSWMPLSAAAKLLGLDVEQVEQLAADGALHGKAIGGDHLSISAKSVQDYLDPTEPVAGDEDAMSAHLSAEQPAPSYRGGPPLDPQTEDEYAKERNS